MCHWTWHLKCRWWLYPGVRWWTHASISSCVMCLDRQSERPLSFATKWADRALTHPTQKSHDWTERQMFANQSRHGRSVYDEILAREGNWMGFKTEWAASLCTVNKKHTNQNWTSKVTDLRCCLRAVMSTVTQICHTKDSIYSYTVKNNREFNCKRL